MSEFIFEAQPRQHKGSSASGRMRKSGSIPGILYGDNKKSLALELKHDDFLHIIDNQECLSSVVTVKLGDEQTPAIIKALQRHPYANKIVHVDFQRINKNKTITKNIPIETIGVENSPGVRVGALLTLLQAAIEVRCLPEKLPKKIQIDCSTMESSSSLKMSELNVPEGVQLVPLLRGGKEYDHAVVMVGKSR